MVENLLTARPPLADHAAASAGGPAAGEPGVSIRHLDAVTIFGVLAIRRRLAELHQAMTDVGFAPTGPGRMSTVDACALLWSGPDQWTIAAEGSAGAVAARLAEACRPHALVVCQSDARALVEVSGPRARAALAKLVPIDLHSRVFGPTRTVQTSAGGIPLQLWQAEDGAVYRMTVPRSFAADFWSWLIHASAEYGSAATLPVHTP